MTVSVVPSGDTLVIYVTPVEDAVEAVVVLAPAAGRPSAVKRAAETRPPVT